MIEAWLPANASLPNAAAIEIEEAIDQWSQHWFLANRFRPISRFTRKHGPIALDDTGWHEADGLAIGLSPDAEAALGALALGLERVTGDLTAADRTLVVAVAIECVRDLRERLAKAVGLAPRAQWHSVSQGGSWSVDIAGEARMPQFRIALNVTRVAALWRRCVPLVTTKPLGRGDDMLAQLTAELSARLGACTISLDDLEELAVGDVVKLKTRLDDPLCVVIGEQHEARGQAALVDLGERLALQLTDSLA